MDNKIIKLCEIKTNGLLGGKAYVLFKALKDKNKGVCTCGSRVSTQIKTVSEVCKILNLPCHIFMPNGDSEIRGVAETNGAKIHIVTPAYNTVLNKRALDYANENDLLFIPLGMLNEYFIKIVEDFTFENKEKFLDKEKIIIPIGGGCFFIGICRCLLSLGYKGEILGVMCGMDATKNINKYLILNEQIKIVKSEKQYKEKSKNVFGLNETYEAKCLDFLTDNAFLVSIAK